MPDLHDNPHERIGEEWYDSGHDEIFTIIGVDNGEKYRVEYLGADVVTFPVDFFEDEIGYRFQHAHDAPSN